MNFTTPRGMSRRHFMQHLAGASALAGPALALTHSLRANAAALKRDHKACILLWMGGGPPTIDMWDMKPGATTGGKFKPIATAGAGQINELLPMVAKQMDHLSIVRSMSTREADHTRGTYYLHTGFVPNPNVIHPGYGSVVAYELAAQTAALEIPPFVSVGGASEGPGFLGMAYAPFQVDSNGRVRDLDTPADKARMSDRMQLLGMLERRFIDQNRGSAAAEHAKVLKSTVELMSSQQMEAFKVDSEPTAMKERYGTTGFGRGCLMARRLVETGVPFVEVQLGGWDLHQNCFTTLETKLPELDKAMSALVEDLDQRGLLDDTLVLWMGEFGRTPRINENAGRDHWARSWSVVLGGGGIPGGKVIGTTNEDGTAVTTEPYSSEDLMATVCRAMGISLETVFTASNGRPMKIANGGKVIGELVA
ncbi:DUF1501 domain-containing protein [Lacipirellula limnantheis]|uniref:DUF1501 domain-containing protein n=1 Tax=Lacipirellula limnantheis TaxID=2528024 RepID=A0A517TSK3_9BACT|nr:DUF1501 domain-containing protein [Lacipirellula limnantheis]QDT71354.1 hypothetical protein I41_05110 [Lacipirellula limnantheis]